MRIPVYHIDAFADSVFEGNPAAVCVLQNWPSDDRMQHIAQEHNLAETAFCVPCGNKWELRWFTPEGEIDLCGHATLAAAYVLLEQYGISGDCVRFLTKSGELQMKRRKGFYEMSLPIREGKPCEIPIEVVKAIGLQPVKALRSRDLIFVYESQEQIERLAPDFSALAQTGEFGIAATAPGVGSDFVSRYFAPGCVVPEDPVTGSSHCTLVPYWAAQTGKMRLTAQQLSRRGGKLLCELTQNEILLAGKAILYSRGEIYLKD